MTFIIGALHIIMHVVTCVSTTSFPTLSLLCHHLLSRVAPVDQSPLYTPPSSPTYLRRHCIPLYNTVNHNHLVCSTMASRCTSYLLLILYSKCLVVSSPNDCSVSLLSHYDYILSQYAQLMSVHNVLSSCCLSIHIVIYSCCLFLLN